MTVGSEGLNVTLHPDGDVIGAVTVTSERLVTASQVLRGQPVGQALKILPLLFSLCGQAQQVAGERAVEAAQGRTPDDATEARRKAVLAVEAVQELITPMLMDWPALLGELADMPLVRRLRGACREAYQNPTPATLAIVAQEVAEAGLSCSATDEAGVWQWAETEHSVSARLFKRLRTDGLNDFALSPAFPLPSLAASDLAPMLLADESGTFRALPTWQGRSAETGPLARQWNHPAIASMRAGGVGLAVRVAARVIDLHAGLAALRSATAGRSATDTVSASSLRPGTGTGIAEAARGVLAHHVDLDGQVVRDWRILAPTEWTFHPQGAVSRGLVGQALGGDILRRAELLTKMLDPCVVCRVRLG